MISTLDDQDFEVFWPVAPDCIEAENFKVKMVNEAPLSSYVVQDFIMQSLQDDYELTVKMVQASNWPHHCASISEIYCLPTAVQDMLGYQNGPIVVVDR